MRGNKIIPIELKEVMGKYKTVDDRPYGGGAGMILRPDILFKAIENIKKEEKLRKLSAVQNDRILFVNDDILFRAGPRVVDAVEIIAKFLANEDQ